MARVSAAYGGCVPDSHVRHGLDHDVQFVHLLDGL